MTKKVNLADLLIAARTVYGEGRGEPKSGQRAIAWVLKNRWTSNKGQFRKDTTLAATCLRWCQFSAWLPGDVNQNLMQEVDLNDKQFRRCMIAVLEVLDADCDTLTMGSTHYHDRRMEVFPAWTKGKKHEVAIGHHYFYKGIK